jgi:hypothetical protein
MRLKSTALHRSEPAGITRAEEQSASEGGDLVLQEKRLVAIPYPSDCD